MVFPKHPVGYLSSLRATSLWLHRLTESLPGLHSRLRRYKTRKCKATPRLFINDSRDRKSGASDKRWVQLQRWKSVASRLQAFANSSNCVGSQGLHSECGRFCMFQSSLSWKPKTYHRHLKKKSLPLHPAMSHFVRIFAVYVFLNFQFFSYIFQAAYGVGFPRRITTKILY